MRRKSAFFTALIVASIGGVAVAASLTHDEASEWGLGTPTLTNIDAAYTGDVITMSSVSSEAVSDDDTNPQNFFRDATSNIGSRYHIQLDKDSDQGSVWANSDACLPDTVGISTADTLLLGTDTTSADADATGFSYRGGQHNNSTDSEESTLADGFLVSFDDGSGTDGFAISEIRFLTGAARDDTTSDDATYTVTVAYSDLSSEVITPTIKNDTVTAAGSRAGSGTGWEVNYGGTIGTDACTASAASLDEVVITTTIPADETVIGVMIEYPQQGEANGYLWGPLALSLNVAEADYDALYPNQTGLYVAGDPATNLMDAGSDAIWYQVSWSETLNGGDAEISFSCSDSATIPGSYDHTVSTALGDTKSGEATNAACPGACECVGQYVHYQIDLTAELATSPDVSALKNAQK